MVFEQFLESENVKKHSAFVFLLGVFYVFVGYIVSAYFFKDDVSIAMLFTTTLLLVPSIYVLLAIEEKMESRQGVKKFYHNHKDIFKVFLFLFLGIFAAFVFLGALRPEIFSYQNDFLEVRGDLDFAEGDDMSRLSGIITQNLMVVVIAFVLSVFYGAGALFLIVLNASIFASFIDYVMRELGNRIVFGLFLIHLVPELGGFLLAAISGGVVSRALMREKAGSKGFKNVLTDALVLLLVAALLIIIAGFLEVFVSGKMALGMV
ncbi:hypothetical protein GF336_06305 [Candidatus Woesearchaeota archaeon]|nr:hypothetical protein [Candidatus Woesearchaeota archaeon]